MKKANQIREFLESYKTAKQELGHCLWQLEQPNILGTEAEQSLLTKKQDCLRQMKNVAEFLGMIEEQRYRIILQLRYCGLFSWERVQEELEKCALYYSDRQIYRLHREALQYLEASGFSFDK